MTKFTPKPTPLPSREDVVAFIAREVEAAKSNGAAPGKIGKREIARAFGIKGDDRIGLKALLRELEADGAVERRHKIVHKPGVLPGVVVCDLARDADGDLVAMPIEWDVEASGPAPKIALHVPKRTRTSGPPPGVGDRALVRNERVRDPEAGQPAYEGRIIKLLPRAKTQLLGVFRATPDGGGRIQPVDKKAMGRELIVPAAHVGDAQDGDLVAVEPMRETRHGLTAASVKERLGSLNSERALSLIAIHTHNIPNVFRRETLQEAEGARAADMGRDQAFREDWRDVALVTIDPPDAKDHDDAVHAARDDDPSNEGGFIVTVAIADVAAYVAPGSPLDREALDRGNSVYFPDRVVPMLPERISNELCSLKPDEDRPAIAVRMTIDSRGAKVGHSFHRIMMRSCAKLHYAQAQAAIDGAPDRTTAPLLEPVLTPLWEAYRAVKLARDARHPLELDLPERKLMLAPDGTVDRVVSPARLDAHRLIEEFMILANVAAAETLEDKKQALIYRAHDEPSIAKLNALAEFLASIGIKLAKGQVIKPEQFNGILARVKGTPNENLVNDVVLRSQAQAEYVADNYGHFGLHLRRYAHFTSPIRRYADLVVHRALIRSLKLGPGGLPDVEAGVLAEIAARISAAERRAMAAERETVDRLIASHLADRVGASFTGRISGVTRSGLFVKLADTGADGFIPASTLGDDYFRYDEAMHAMVGARTGETHRLGDIVEVQLVEAAPFAGALRFALLTEGAVRGRPSGADKPARDKARTRPGVLGGPPKGISRRRKARG